MILNSGQQSAIGRSRAAVVKKEQSLSNTPERRGAKYWEILSASSAHIRRHSCRQQQNSANRDARIALIILEISCSYP